MVRKVLRALISEWEKKTTAIEEANNLFTLTLENLVGNQEKRKNNFKRERRENNQRRKYLPSKRHQIRKIQMMKKKILP